MPNPRENVIKNKFPFWVAALLFLCPATLFAGSPEGPGLGARAAAMGGAFIGLADDWTATYWNPAGLAQHETGGFGVTSDFAVSHVKDGNSIANPLITAKNADQGDPFGQLPAPYMAEPTKFNKTNISSSAVLPGLGAYTPMAGITFGVSAYQSLGYNADWADNLTTGFGSIGAHYKTKLSLNVVNLSVAKKIVPSLSVGAGVNFMNGEFDRYARKNTYNTTVPALSYSSENDLQTAGHSVEGVFGFLFQPNEQLNIGGVYRTGSQMNMEGNHTINNTPNLPAPLTDVESGVRRVFNQPATYGIGLAFKPLVNWTITADWQRTEWDKVRTELWYQAASQLNTSDDADWRNTERWRIGTEYKPCEQVALRAGFYLDPSQIPNKAVSLSNLVEVNRKTATAGIGYKGANYQVDLTYLYTWGSANIYGVDYGKTVNSVQAAVSTWF